ncbi:threonylcarbamoyl-AMP synthase [Elioraea tepida]|jgi:L-threonylcarbamoyladenylate synthase|uniref:Threonylcarbamoyl-AMP synthase n=1 Tax=Elioraea tepida TaxID=2843330 RepID=A0A975TZJ0_9PROT|nr:L-threonylcarbamoyladenylate synthase [Elioraea tepida]QXM23461.1 threonylcarbamoyl-AMP synthase [Elioraea tepida]
MTRRLGADTSGIAEAASLLRSGRLVAFPTETVYGLGADATDDRAVAAVFEAKGRPHFNPLIVHAADAAGAFALGRADERAERLAQAFWPGPLTLVLPCRRDCPVALLARSGLETVALRVPAHPVALALLRAAAVPVAAPSANRSGAVSPTAPQHVLEDLAGRIEAVVDGGACPIGVESTVLDLSGPVPVLLRPGGATIEAIEEVIGPVARPLAPEAAEASRTLRSPGLLVSHYAPVLPVRLLAERAGEDEALLAFGPEVPLAPLAFNLSERGDLAEAAARLFSGLRFLDAEGRARGLRRIAAMPVPSSGLGLAINDRLKRAAAPR